MKKLTGIVLAAAFVLSATTSVSAQTVADLQAQIDALLAQLSAVATTGSTTAGYNFVSDLTIGSTGPSVVELQTALELQGALVMPAGVSRGYFGPLTKAALGMYQAKVGISPASGYFGPITRAHFNSLVAPTMPGTTPGTTPTNPGSSNSLNGGEASLEDFDMKDGDDNDIEEGNSGEIAEIEFDVEDGDVEIQRLDLSFEFVNQDADSGTGENDPWDAFETITLRVDGDEIASEDVSDEDDWLENDDEPYIFRFNNLDYMVEEGDMVKIIVEIEAANGVDESDDAGVNDWKIFVDEDGIRALDGAGIDQYIGDEDGNDESATFGIEEAGDGEELNLSLSSNNPDAETLQVDDDNESDWETIYIVDAEAEDNDIEIDEVTFQVVTTGGNYEEIVSDAMIMFDGEDFDVDDVDFYTGATFVNLSANDGNTPTAFALLTFDIDDDVTIDEDDEMEIELMLEFRSTDDQNNYANGATVQATQATISGEGEDDVTDTLTTAGDVFTLASEGITVDATNDNATSSAKSVSIDGAANDYAEFDLMLKVMAFEEDAFIDTAIDVSVNYQIVRTSDNVVVYDNVNTGSNAGTVTGSLDSSADIDVDSYRVDEGTAEDMTVNVTYTPAAPGSYRLRVLTIEFGVSDAANTTDTYTAEPQSDYRTRSANIVD